MNPIAFDNNLNCIIRVSAEHARISFLTNPLFTNNKECLKKDIAHCLDSEHKTKLERILKDLIEGRFCFMYDEWGCHNDEEGVISANISGDFEVTADDRVDGNWMAIVHNVYAEHTGFWYAAMDFANEIRNIEEHIHLLQGYQIFAEHTDDILLVIRNSTCSNNALSELLKRGLSKKQAHAILQFSLASLARLEKDAISKAINNCCNLIEILKEYA